jgi:hypothetical protein
MADTDLSGPDRQVGSLLSGEEVERLRDAINWVRQHRGLRMKEIARDSDIPEHTIRNFAYRKSVRPDSACLGRLQKYFVGNRELLPEGYFATGEEAIAEVGEGLFGRLARFDLVKMELPISESDLKRVYDRYNGYYLCFRRSERAAHLSVSWLHILPLRPTGKTSRWGLPLPRFTMFIKYPDPLDPTILHSYIIVGYSISRNGQLYLCGQHDGELKFFILTEPSINKYTYIQGLCLFTAALGKHPFGARLICQFLGTEADREDWSEQIGVFPRDQFATLFDNAEIIERALGDSGVLFTSDVHS